MLSHPRFLILPYNNIIIILLFTFIQLWNIKEKVTWDKMTMKKKKSRETISQNKNDFFSPINHFVYTIYVKIYYEHVRIHARGWLNVYTILWHHIFLFMMIHIRVWIHTSRVLKKWLVRKKKYNSMQIRRLDEASWFQRRFYEREEKSFFRLWGSDYHDINLINLII